MRNLLILSLPLTILYGCSNMNITPPIADKKEKKLIIHDDTRIDNYYWLNERENPEVISYLDEENRYTQSILKSTKSFQKKLFNEMKSRIKEDDNSVPYFYNDYWYVTKYEKGKDYPIYTRKHMQLDAEEEIILDVNLLAKDYKYFRVSGISISPDNKKVSYGVDTLSRRIYTIKIKNLDTDEMYSDNIVGVNSYAAWADDSQTIFYTGKDSQTLRSDKIYRHKLDSDQKDDILVFEEKDETFSTYVYPSKSREYIMIGSGSTMSTEYRYLSSKTPLESFKVIQAASIEEGEKALASNKIDVIILDLMLPDGSGLTLCRDIKSEPKTKNIPVIILTAKTEEVDRVVGFELGADDYVTKPFSVRELILRVKAILKRGASTENNTEDAEYSFGELTINFEEHQAYITGEEISLTALEFKLLKHLIKRKGRVQTRDQLLEDVWGYSSNVTTRTVDTHIKRLREKLGLVGEHIQTIRGVGYRFSRSSD